MVKAVRGTVCGPLGTHCWGWWGTSEKRDENANGESKKKSGASHTLLRIAFCSPDGVFLRRGKYNKKVSRFVIEAYPLRKGPDRMSLSTN
jgi:hypothetical protein